MDADATPRSCINTVLNNVHEWATWEKCAL